VVQTYLDGLYEGNVEKLAAAFHPTSSLTYEENGSLTPLPRDQWLEAVRSRPSPQSRGLPRHDRILQIDQASPTTAFVKLNCAIPPLVTTAVLLDARSHVGKGRPMADGELVTAAHIEAMLKAQGLAKRGILPGDMVWIYTGWSDFWKDGEEGAKYYAMAPGLSVDAAKFLATKRIVAIGLDAPFIDPVPNGMLQGKAPPAQGTEPGLPFSIHHYMLSVFGIHHLENLNLAAMAGDRVWTSCAMVLPSRDQGAAGAVLRPVAIGLPDQR
jgi:kynurenine formamidase